MATNFYFGIIGAPVYQPSEIYEHMQSNQTKVDRSIVHLINTVQRYCFFVAFKQIITMMMMMMTMMMMMMITLMTRKARQSLYVGHPVVRMDRPTTPLLCVCISRPHGRRRRDAGPSARFGVARSLCP